MIQRIFNGAGRQVAGLYGKALLDVNVEWQAPLPRGPKIIAANHPTTADPFLLMGLIGEPMSILITESCFKLPGLGAFLHAAGHVPVVSGSGKAALDEGIRLLRAGRTVGIFPEGVLSPLDQLGRSGCCPPHTGVARLALATGAPVIPVGISLDPARIIFRDTQIDGVTEHVRWYVRGPYFVTAGRPLAVTGSLEDQEGVRLAAARIMHRIAGLAQHGALRLRSEVELGAAPVPVPSFGRD
ncbi:MAG: 1-acyl-sn-glycerol-3-phosphate acyltransferase [Anaerolineae bacterium]|nr:1-acyl-sn-glycerol-3-phosphate acyltransferase [Anaerolineae bacterium]